MARRNPLKTVQPRAWQRMLSGRRLDLLDPSPLDVEIEDIAHGLARVARWNGQTLGDDAFSVAEHSVLVEMICRQMKPDLSAAEQMTALLHDAAEYVIGDMISPFKAVLGGSYKEVEARLERAIHLRFGLPAQTPARLKALIKRADHICAWYEATQLAGFAPSEADAFFGQPPEGISLRLAPKPPADAQAAFLARHNALVAAMDSEASGP
ncbi:MAG: HD family hydrolase [Pseudomonadota bacterium]